MSILEAILLGIIQGLTEFLPVSSSGHLAIFERFFGIKQATISFDVFLHLGTLIAVFLVYWKDIIKLIRETISIIVDVCNNIKELVLSIAKRKEAEYRRIVTSAYRKFALLVIVSTIPTGILGILLKDIVGKASATLIVPGICLLITAALLYVSDRLPDGDRTPKNTNWIHAIFIGIIQGLATFPGISRSGSTITAGVFCGMRRDFVVKYSFLMSIPAILGAVVLEIPEMKADIAKTSALAYILGVLFAAVVGYICIKTMLVIVKKKKFTYFSYYCVLMGIVAIIGSMIK